VHPIRKHNRLADYDYSQPGAYFITLCVKDRRCLLSTIVGADAHIGPQPKLAPFGNVVEKYLKTIPGIGPYVIMPNHVHMILHISANDVRQGPMWASAPTEASVPNLIRSFKTLVSKELGESIWQRSYYDHVIRDEADYLVRVRYIEENPSKWLYDDYYIP
jgi:REP element-mobilizing transposase RayT